MLDRSILPCSVHRLEHDEQGVCPLRIEHILQLRQFPHAAFQPAGGLFLVFQFSGRSRITGGKPDLCPRRKDELCVFHGIRMKGIWRRVQSA